MSKVVMFVDECLNICFRMVLEPKGDTSTDGIENGIGTKGVSCTRNQSLDEEYVEIDMPPANGHLVSTTFIV